MTDVSIRDLRNHGGEIVDRANRGEPITITRHGTAVATLNPMPPRGTRTETLIEHARHLPPMDPEALRRDLDAIIDPHL
jgi:prevent-host-death family protein